MSQSTLPRVSNPPPIPAQARSVAEPDRAMGVVKLLVALAATTAGTYLIIYNLGRGASISTGQGVFLGIILGFGLRLLLTGGAQVARKRIGWTPSLVVFGIVVVAMGFGMPRAAEARMVKVEREAWERLEASPRTLADYETYKLWTSRPRKGFASAMAMAQVKEELAKMEGEKTGRVTKLRSLIRDYQYDMDRKSREPELAGAIELARGGIARIYQQALADLAVRVEAAATKSEFPEDPQMRAAFATLLERVARSDDNRVYLVFSSENAVATTRAAATAEPEARSASKLPLIPPGDAFSPSREDRRRKSFVSAMEEALGKAFAEPLIQIEPLAPGADRKGKTIFQVHCATRKAPDEFILTRDGKEVGRLFSVEVMWEFAIFDADGKALTRSKSRSMPGDEFRFRRGDDDPAWAAYSVMMDSAYFNYCRQITGRLGLIPVAQKEYFMFQK